MHVTIFIALTVYAQATAPFKSYFQVLCILGFVRTGIGAPIGDALYEHALEALTALRLANISSSIGDISYVQPFISQIPQYALCGAIRELYGWSILLGLAVLILIAASRFRKHIARPIPTIKRLYGVVIKNASLLRLFCF